MFTYLGLHKNIAIMLAALSTPHSSLVLRDSLVKQSLKGMLACVCECTHAHTVSVCVVCGRHVGECLHICTHGECVCEHVCVCFAEAQSQDLAFAKQALYH